jgi:hypothetical protein
VNPATNHVYGLENTPVTFTYTVSDLDSVLSVGNFWATSSDPAIVPISTNSTIAGSFAPAGPYGSSGDVTVTVYPATDAYGDTQFGLIVNDGYSLVTDTLTLTINHVHQAPSISSIPNLTIVEGNQATNLAFTVGSVEVPASGLVVTAHSSKQAVVPDTGLHLSGFGATRSIQIRPLPTALAATATITVSVTDSTSTNATSFTLTVQPAPPTITPSGEPLLPGCGVALLGALLATVGAWSLRQHAPETL